MTRPPPATPLTLNLAPMVDVMMCLLIFFMLATKMVEQEHTRLDLPVAAGVNAATLESESGRFVVNVRRGAGVEPEYMLREERLSFDDLTGRLGRAAKLDSRVACLVRAERSLPYSSVEAVLIACRSAGVRDVRLGAVREEGGR